MDAPPFPEHDFSVESTGEGADQFKARLEEETTELLLRSRGDAERTKTAIFLFVSRAYKAKMPQDKIGALFAKCFICAGRLPEEQDTACGHLEFFGAIARIAHPR